MLLSELTWLNEYHREVYDKLLPGLRETGDETALQCVERFPLPFFPFPWTRAALTLSLIDRRWLEEACKPVQLAL